MFQHRMFYISWSKSWCKLLLEKPCNNSQPLTPHGPEKALKNVYSNHNSRFSNTHASYAPFCIWCYCVHCTVLYPTPQIHQNTHWGIERQYLRASFLLANIPLRYRRFWKRECNALFKVLPNYSSYIFQCIACCKCTYSHCFLLIFKDTTTTMPTIPTRKTGTEEEEEEEEEEDLRTFYNPDSSAEEETSDNTRYQPPYEVVISSLMPFGRPNLRGLLSYSGSKKLNRLVSRPPKNSIRRVLNVTETLFYATLNHSSPQVIALFAHDIVQECVQRTPFMPYQCQPHYDTMPNSSKKYFNFFGLF